MPSFFFFFSCWSTLLFGAFGRVVMWTCHFQVPTICLWKLRLVAVQSECRIACNYLCVNLMKGAVLVIIIFHKAVQDCNSLFLIYLQVRTVKVSNVSIGATERDLKEFFSFSGDIEYVEVQRYFIQRPITTFFPLISIIPLSFFEYQWHALQMQW